MYHIIRRDEVGYRVIADVPDELEALEILLNALVTSVFDYKGPYPENELQAVGRILHGPGDLWEQVRLLQALLDDDRNRCRLDILCPSE
jgi:hypothetical protein